MKKIAGLYEKEEAWLTLLFVVCWAFVLLFVVLLCLNYNDRSSIRIDLMFQYRVKHLLPITKITTTE